MVIDGKLPEGYVVLCDSCENSSFLVRRLGPSVECPTCGATDLSVNLMTDYVLKNSAANRTPPLRIAAE